MTPKEALELIAAAVPRAGGTWVDCGAGQGTFTRALAERLAPTATIYAVDHDPRAVATLRRWASRSALQVVPVEADFSRPLELPGLKKRTADGMLLANALHFVRDADQALARLVEWLRPGGRVVVIEYDRRPASRWVPYPVPLERLSELATFAGLATPSMVATRPSAYGGNLYVAVADRLA